MSGPPPPSPSIPTLAGLLPTLRQFAISYYDPADDLHGVGHVRRVLHIAQNLHQREGGSWPVIEAAIWLHDIGRQDEAKMGIHHALLSSHMAAAFFLEHGLTTIEVSEVIHAIEAHSFSIGGRATTLEAQLVSDADKLDALGAVGIFRVCAYQGQKRQGIPQIIAHCHEKLYVLGDQMYLPSSKARAEELTARIRDFVAQLLEETGEIDPWDNSVLRAPEL